MVVRIPLLSAGFAHVLFFFISILLPDFEPDRILDVRLVPAPILLNPISVSASRREERLFDAPAAVNMIARREIETKVVLSTTEHLKGMPGVDVVSSGISQDRVVVRGFNGAVAGRLLTLADNRIINIPANRWIMSQLIQPSNDDIERIEVVSGPGSALYGPNSAGGVLHIITKSPFESQGTTVSAAVGERNLLIGSFRHAGMFNKRVGYKISSRYYQATDWKLFLPSERDSIILGRQTPTGRVNIGGKISNEPDFDMVNISGDGRLDFRLDNGLEAIFSGGLTRTSNIEPAARRWQARNWMLGYVQTRLLYENLFAQIYYNWNDTGDSFNRRSGDLIVDKSTQLVTQIQHGFSLLSDRQRFTYGVDLSFIQPKSEQTLMGRNEDRDNAKEIGVYLQSETDLSSSLKWVFAGRFDKSNHLSEPAFSPRVALIFKPSFNHNFRLTYNKAFQVPEPFALYIDLKLIPSLGAYPYPVRILGTPPDTGFNFKKDTNGGIGGFYMQSPYNSVASGGSSQYFPADATQMWNAALDLIKARGTGIPDIPPPASAQVGTVLKEFNLNTGGFDVVTSEDIADVLPSVARKTTTFELGYKGIINNQLFFTANLYSEKSVNFNSGSVVETPNVFFEPVSLTAYLDQFMPDEEARMLADDLSEIPVGVITPEESYPAIVMLSVRRNGGSGSYYGAELGLNYYPRRYWTWGATYTYLSDNFFERMPPGQPDDLSLNVPKHKGSVNIGYHNSEMGLNVQLRGRYVGRFRAISGAGREAIGPYSLLDLDASQKLPFQPNVNLTLSIKNLLNNEHREFVGAPDIGRLAVLRLTYSL